MFPSPYGELHFSILDKAINDNGIISVSVPLRGTTFLNTREDAEKIYQDRVSVPLRGTTFLNSVNIFFISASLAFPSPYGELHFSIKRSKIETTERLGFRPLTGNYISQLLLEYTIKAKGVSVPLRGTTFLNTSDCTTDKTVSSFRPLTGNYISQCFLCRV